MHKHKSIVLAVAAIMVAVPLISHGASLTRPFGGRVLLTAPQMASTIVCAAIRGPFTIQPFNVSTFGPYFVSTDKFATEATKEKNISDQLKQIRNSSTYMSGNPTAEELQREQTLVNQLKESRSQMDTIRSSFGGGAPKSGGYILGLYNSIPNTTTCYNPASGVPLPAFGIKLYGVGGGIGL